MGRRALDLVVLRKGREVAKLRVEADPQDTRELRRLLLDAVVRDQRSERDLGEYAMEICYAGDHQLPTSFVAMGKG